MKNFQITNEVLKNVDMHFSNLKSKFMIATSRDKNYIFFVFEPENPNLTHILGFKDVNKVKDIIGKDYSLLTINDLRNIFKAELESEEIGWRVLNTPFDKLMIGIYTDIYGSELAEKFYLEDITPPKKQRLNKNKKSI